MVKLLILIFSLFILKLNADCLINQDALNVLETLSVVDDSGVVFAIDTRIDANTRFMVECADDTQRIYYAAGAYYLKSMRILCEGGNFKQPIGDEFIDIDFQPADIICQEPVLNQHIQIETLDGVNIFKRGLNGNVLVQQDYPENTGDIVYDYISNLAVKARCVHDPIQLDVRLSGPNLEFAYSGAIIDSNSISRLCPTGSSCSTGIIKLRGLVMANQMPIPLYIRNSQAISVKCAYDDELLVNLAPHKELLLTCHYGNLHYSDNTKTFSDFPEEKFECKDVKHYSYECEYVKVSPKINFDYMPTVDIKNNSIRTGHCVNDPSVEVSVRCILDQLSYFVDGSYTNSTDLCLEKKSLITGMAIVLIAASVLCVLLSIVFIVFAIVKR